MTTTASTLMPSHAGPHRETATSGTVTGEVPGATWV